MTPPVPCLQPSQPGACSDLQQREQGEASACKTDQNKTGILEHGFFFLKDFPR